jgi:hypothetical protein
MDVPHLQEKRLNRNQQLPPHHPPEQRLQTTYKSPSPPADRRHRNHDP